jgi:hypothetical protein
MASRVLLSIFNSVDMYDEGWRGMERDREES